jgi:hypothetical protein
VAGPPGTACDQRPAAARRRGRHRHPGRGCLRRISLCPGPGRSRARRGHHPPSGPRAGPGDRLCPAATRRTPHRRLVPGRCRPAHTSHRHRPRHSRPEQ